MNDKCTAAIFSAVKMQEMLVLFLAHWTSRILSKYKHWLVFLACYRCLDITIVLYFKLSSFKYNYFMLKALKGRVRILFSAALTNVSVLTVGEWSIWEMQTVWNSIKVQFGAAEAECYLGTHTVQLSSATLLIYHFVSALLHTSTTVVLVWSAVVVDEATQSADMWRHNAFH